MKRLAMLLCAAAWLAPAGAARAQDPLTTPTPTPTASPAPAPPAHASMRVGTDAKRSGGQRYVLEGQSFHVTGAIAPALAGEKVIVRVYRGRHKLLAKTVTVSANGTFSVRAKSRRPGRLTLRAVHRASARLGTLKAAPKHLSVLRASAGPGARGPVVRLLQRGLAALHYAVSHTGAYDGATARAVMAYRKVNGLNRVFTADANVVRRVSAGRGAFKPRRPELGHHVEADLSRQVLALIDGSKVVRTYHISSGAPSTPTVLGTYHVYSKTPGTNAKGMVDAAYFIRGYAIHGYVSVPPFNASHGCLRVPIPNARSIFNWVRYGDAVTVYR